MKEIVREYKTEDREVIEQCIFELQEEEIIRQPHFWAKPVEAVNPYFEYLIKSVKDSGGKIFVAELDGQTAGFIAVLINDEDSPAIALKRFAYVMDLAVLKKFRGRGLGKILLLKAEEFAKSNGVDWMQMDVSKSNPALDFYIKAGYREKDVRLEKQLV